MSDPNTALKQIAKQRCFDGEQRRYRHTASSTDCEMTFSIFLPKQALEGKKLPVLYCLSGLTCTDLNFSMQSFAQAYAAKYGIVLLIPDTSPRGEAVPDSEDYDLGQAASFYLNATQEPWQHHFQMYDYIVDELPALIQQEFEVGDQWSICGHSMGGHGALMIGLRNSKRFKSISAFAPITPLSESPWGQKALPAYLGDNQTAWQDYDSFDLLKKTEIKLPILIDQGLVDEFYPKQLQPEKFAEAAQAVGFDCTLRLHEDYGHSYYFVKTFISDHFEFHAKHLGLL